MDNIITVNNPSNRIMVTLPCGLTAAGVAHQLESEPKVRHLVNVIKRLDEAYSEILKIPYSLVILNISQFSSRLTEEVNFINWCRMVQPSAVIVAYTNNHKLSVLNFISALGVRVIISQYEPTATFIDFIIKSLSSRTMLCSPIIQNILQERVCGELTVCEAQVMEQLFLGFSVSQAALNLGRDIRTVSAHKRHAMVKLGLNCEKDLHVLGCALSGK